ncbi:MAG: hypothetical protein K9K34_19320 [Desulfarculaceae bacterium]|nr:hypothetical protein [Desulfarculaceae bacterium]
MKKEINAYVIEYLRPLGNQDKSYGDRVQMIIVGTSENDVKDTFKSANPKLRVVSVFKDTRNCGISMDVVLDILKSKAQSYLKSIKKMEEYTDKMLDAGYQYRSSIVEDSKSNVLVDGVM